MTNDNFIKSITINGEEWKDVVGYEGYYAVSNLGRIAMIRTSCEYTRNGKTFTKSCKPHICGTSISPSTQYQRITFVRNGKKDTQLLHRVIAMAFIPNPYNLPCVDHIDDNPHNSIASNLQWCTYKTNNSKEHHRKAQSLAKIGRIDPKRKPIVALKDNLVVKIYTSMFEANLDGHDNSAILRVLRGQLKHHHGLKWVYLSDYEKSLVNQ